MGKRTATFKPQLSPEGQLNVFVLNHMSGDMTLEQISRLALEKFPDQLDDYQQALSYTANISQSFSE